MIETTRKEGLSVWCNNCQDFPQQYNLKAVSGSGESFTVLKCNDCGEKEIITDD